MPKNSTEIFSIYGQIEEAAANYMVKRHQLTKIPPKLCPPEIQVSPFGLELKFALVIPSKLLGEFEETIRNLRA